MSPPAVKPKASKRRKERLVVHDELTDQWLKKLRDPNSTQSYKRWQGASDPLFTPDLDLQTEDWSARCGVGYLLDIADPNGWRRGGNGYKHRAMRAMRAKYGSRVIDKAIRKNDQGVKLPDIADYVEKELRKNRGS